MAAGKKKPRPQAGRSKKVGGVPKARRDAKPSMAALRKAAQLETALLSPQW